MPDYTVSIAPPAKGPVERDPLMNILALAFSTDPAVRYMFPTADGFLRNFNLLATAMAGSALAAGTAWVADDGAAAALWLGPGGRGEGGAIGGFVREAVGPK